MNLVFESSLHKEIPPLLDDIFSIYQCDFRKDQNAQHCLLTLFESWKSNVEQKKMFCELLTDLSKTFDCLSNDLFLAKFHAYGSDNKLLATFNSE